MTIELQQRSTGPKDQDTLELLSPGLELVVDYGWLWFIAQPLFLIIKFTLHMWVIGASQVILVDRCEGRFLSIVCCSLQING